MIYCVFGLRLRSNLPIPGLVPQTAPAANSATIEINLGFPPPASNPDDAASENLIYTSHYTTEAGEPALHIRERPSDGLLHLQYCDGVQFWMDRPVTRIWAIWSEDSALEDAASYLLGPVLGLALRFQGALCLHASAVALSGRVVAFVGDAGAGKSTTAAAFAREGQVVISDDIVTLAEDAGAFTVQPAYPYLSLWPDSVVLLYGERKSLPSFSRNFDKRLLSLGEHGLQFADSPLPLGAIFLLGERSVGNSAPRVEELDARESLLALVANSYATNLLTREMRAREFAALGRLVGKVPVRRIHPNGASPDLGNLCTTIRGCCEALWSTPRFAANPQGR